MPIPKSPVASSAFVRSTMQGNRAKDTKPEMIVRRIVFGLGFRYRLHDSRIVGKPDLAFWRRRKLIFVHGCFWHQHSGCLAGRVPKTNSTYWRAKLSMNKSRDTAHAKQLMREGWESLVIWECETKDLYSLTERLRKYLMHPK